jgi:uncharacterized RDD family membrane protein YckC/Tfp pilus assembly major pilin PilA
MNPTFAGFWRRAAAFLVDSLILVIPQTLLNIAFAPNTTVPFLINIVIALAYFAGFHSSAKQATPGKMAFGIKVTDDAGQRISIGRAVGRYFATWLSALILGIGYFMAGFTERKRALHDMVCKTLVVNKAVEAADIEENQDTMPVTAGVWAVVGLLFVLPFVGGIVAAITIPAYQDYTRRAKIAEALGQVEPIKEEVAAALGNRRPAPAGVRRVASPAVQQVNIANDGQITIVFSKDAVGGGQAFFAPIVSRTAPVEWRCWAEGVAPKYMPAVCRGG